MKKPAFAIAFALGLLAIVWVAAAVASTHVLVLLMTAAIGGVYLYGARELHRFRTDTASLQQALAEVPAQLPVLNDWLARIPAALQNPVRQRIEAERGGLPGPAFTPYLVGLLVMLGMLGTFIGMVVTLNGAVFALEGSASVQAMRAAFSEPVKGLGLAFGTSVAGVASSAMLGLMSSLARQERALAAHTLDALIGSRLQAFSLVHQRQETFRALQLQTRLLPEVTAQLQQLMGQMERHSQQLSERLQAQQDQFHREVSSVYTGLARSVDESLRNSLGQSMQLASDSLRPVVQDTLTRMARQADVQHERLVEHTQAQLLALQQQLAERMEGVWRSAGQQTLEQQQQVSNALTQTADTVSAQIRTQAGQTLAQLETLVARQDALLQARIAAEATAAAEQARHAQALATLLREELQALRGQEAERGEAAVARLADLEQAVAGHLTQLGAALEAPITRLIETASEAPRAAAEVIGQLRQEISASVARDNALLEERARILQTLNTLLDAIHHASGEQRQVIDALVQTSRDALEETRRGFQAEVAAEAGKLGEVAAQVTASAVDVASLGETFGFAVRSFNETHERLMASLQRMEAAIGQSMARSDEQLAYYVAQAREIIDLSISSQKDVLDALQQRQAQGAA